jgi:uncharacterized protein involved in response to NO
MSLGHSLLLVALIAAVASLQLAGRMVWGDVLFAVAVVTLIAIVLRQWPERRDLPPPGMVLAGLGLLCGAGGAIASALAASGVVSPFWFVLGKILMYHGMILLPVLGMGAYLLPRMMGLPNRQLVTPKSPVPSRLWRSRASLMAACGVLLMVSFVLEAAGWLRPAYILRVATAVFCLLREVPMYRASSVNTTLPKALAIAAISIMVGLVLLAVWPARVLTYVHVLFISGYGLLILAITARVVLGHSGNHALIFANSNAMRWIIGLVLLAMATRVSADLLPRMQLSHYAYAALTWVVVSLIWLVAYGPYLLEAPADGDAP